jgi:hypothetical protein
MKQSEIDNGKRLAEKAIKWWGSTIPSFEHANYQDEPIPALNRWLHEVAFPALEKGAKNAKSNCKVGKVRGRSA